MSAFSDLISAGAMNDNKRELRAHPRQARLPEWMSKRSERKTFLDALRYLDCSQPLPTRVPVPQYSKYPFSRRVLEIDRFEGELDPEFWDALESAGFPWKAPNATRHFGRTSERAPQTSLALTSRNSLSSELEALRRGTITFSQVMDLRNQRALESDPVVAWCNRGLQMMQRANMSLVEACASPNFRLALPNSEYDLGTFTRELLEAATAGVLGAVTPQLDHKLSKRDLLLLRNLGHAAAWHREHPTMQFPVERVVALHDGSQYELGRWVLYVRQTIRKGTAHPRLIDALRIVGIEAFPSRFDRAWVRGITAFTQFIEREGHSRVPHDHVEYLLDGSQLDLEGWWRRTRAQYRQGELPPDCIETFHRLGISLEGVVRVREDAFRLRLADIDRFIAQHGHAEIPAKYIATRPNGKRTYLGSWITYIRTRAEAGLLEPRHLDALQLRGLRIDLRNADNLWAVGVQALEQYRAREGDQVLSERHIEYLPDGTEVPLGAWVARHKLRHREGKLTPERQATLRSLGINIESYRDLEREWQTGLAAFRQFVTREGHGAVPVSHREQLPDGTMVSLGNWVSTKRKQHKAQRLSDDRIATLEALGFAWTADAQYVRIGFELLHQFREREGHLDVPERYVTADPEGKPFALGSFLATRRKRLRDGKLVGAQRDQLLELGVDGEHRYDRVFREGFESLTRFVAEHGHGVVPRAYIEHLEDGRTIKLGSWATNMLNQRREGRLAPDRIALLDAAGFVWSHIEQRFQWNLAALEAFRAEHGHLRIPDTHEVQLPDGSTTKLASWLRSQQERVRDGYMRPDQLAALKERGALLHVDASRYEPDLGR
ncbi:MAG: helicase associated domain-containing protein [Acidimicrobiia bacterium]